MLRVAQTKVSTDTSKESSSGFSKKEEQEKKSASDKNQDSSSTKKRPWTLQDSIGVRYVALDPSYPTARAQSEAQDADLSIVASPDGEYFFFASTWGELESDSDVTALSVYRTRSVLKWLDRSARGSSLIPDRSIVLRSRNYRGSLTDPAWDADSRSILFQGNTGAGAGNAFRLDMSTGSLNKLTTATSPAQQISWVTTRGDGIFYVERLRGRQPAARYPAEWVERRKDGSIYQGIDLVLRNSRSTPYVSFRGQPSLALQFDGDNLARDYVWLSPDGSRAIGMARGIEASGRQLLPFVQIDLQSARVTRMVGIEGGDWGMYAGTSVRMPAYGAYWSEDGKRAILVNVIASRIDEKIAGNDTGQYGADVSGEPSGDSGTGGLNLASRTQSIIEFELDSGKWQELEPLVDLSSDVPNYVGVAGWLKPGRELLVTHLTKGYASEGTLYSFGAHGVESRRVAPSVALPSPATGLVGRLKVELVQGANEPPRVIAKSGQREAVLTSSDPALEGVQLQRTEQFSWREADGKVVRGGLTLPRGFAKTKSKPVPLVIHAYFNRPEQFLPDGASRATDAAQVLAARGMAALQIDIPLFDTTLQEGPLLVARIESAVGELARQGIVDPALVGLSGFSHAGYETLYAVTHPGQLHLAAAMGADFFTGTFSDYLAQAARVPKSSLAASYEATSGGSFWEKKAEWLKYESSFNVDRVVTPLLITNHGYSLEDKVQVRRDIDVVVSLLGAFMRNEKPIDYLYLGYSSHQVFRPLERLASMQAMVDWMSFWLQNKEDLSTLNDQLCSRPDVLAVKGSDLSVNVGDDGQPKDSENVKPWYWLDCTKEGISKVRADREAMYARWRPMGEQQRRSVEAAASRPKTKFIEVPDDFDTSTLPKIH